MHCTYVIQYMCISPIPQNISSRESAFPIPVHAAQAPAGTPPVQQVVDHSVPQQEIVAHAPIQATNPVSAEVPAIPVSPGVVPASKRKW